MNLLRACVTTVTAVATLMSLAACGSSEPRSVLSSIEAGKVILGTKYDQPGLGLRHPDKSMSGIDVDIATYVVNSIADEHGWAHPEITWRETPSAQRETLIKNGEVDMITATYSINANRAKAVSFGGPYLVTHQALLVRNDDHSLDELADLANGRKLCSVTGSTPAQKIKAELPEVQLQEYDSYSSCVEALHQKKVDALTTDATILGGFAAQYEGEFRVVAMNKADGKPFTNERYGIGHAKGDSASTEAINKALEKMYADGSFDRIMTENLGEDAKVVEQGKPGDLSFLDAK
ncbi:ABC transporter glutamine-binding protein GlnH precursor [Corynebacterium kalinowskii]|uniref:ABC transporter glutamine-binding protein GlnH n=1 Tax=Corynebacterium kalinowskii TaxID=2675216 RepID=A0A6B8VDG3_9CORY|nr:glutamate ABC transporter substrate-binding protein [Corynebacterium kalinowskii]QGU02223.1 ABC transporter glutamine-binding protein GlnH precursor [Corynebacterium kalinowskii]